MTANEAVSHLGASLPPPRRAGGLRIPAPRPSTRVEPELLAFRASLRRNAALCAWWIAASAMLMPATVLLVWLIGSRYPAPLPVRMPTVLVWLMVAAPVGGAVLGFGQWLVLRHHLPHLRVSWWWTPATVLGWLAGLTVFPIAPLAADAILRLWQTVASVPPSFRFRNALPASLTVGGALLGVLLAAAQSLVLRRRLHGLGTWTWGSAAGWAFGLLVGPHLPQIPVLDRPDGFSPWIGVIPGLTAAAMVYGLSSALALVWLLREPILPAGFDPLAVPEGDVALGQ